MLIFVYLCKFTVTDTGSQIKARHVYTILTNTHSKHCKAYTLAIPFESYLVLYIIKIILHRIISVVWLTNFLSEILNQSTHDDELNNFLWAWRGGWALSRARSRWWSLTLPGGGWRRELLSEWSGSWKGFSSHSYMYLIISRRSVSSWKTHGFAVL